MTEEKKLNVNKFRISDKEFDVDRCREVLPLLLYITGYCSYEVFQKFERNGWKNLIYGRHNLEEILEINSYFQEIKSGSLLYPNC